MNLSDLREHLESRDWQETEPDSDDPVRFALIGLGWWTVEETLPAIAAEDGLETTVLVSSTAEKAAHVAEEHDHLIGDETGADVVPLDYDAFQDGAATDDYDAVYVCTPNALHLPYVETAAELGKPVLCEKPLEATAERAAALVEAAEDVPAMTAYRMHTEPAIRVARELIRDGAIGDPVAVQSHMTQDAVDMGGADQWRFDPDLAGPGASVTDLGIYPINTARFLLDREPVAAHAAMHGEHDAFDDVPDERAGFLIEYAGGVTASCTVSQRAQKTGELRVIGTEGEVGLQPAYFADDRRELVYRDGDVETRVSVPDVDQMQEEVAYFADCLRDGREIEADVEEGLADVRAIEAVYAANERGERVEIGE